MSLDKFESLCDYFSSHGIESAKIMGGEPTIHPEFLGFVNIAQKYFERIGIFSNGISEIISAFIPRERDSITYNFNFSKVITKEKLLLTHPGKRLLEIQVRNDTNTKRLLQEISRIYQISENRAAVTLTLDCTANIFDHRQSILENFKNITSSLSESGIPFRIDHKVPLCFSYNSDYPVTKKGAICSLECAGLIDSQYNLRYCNQFSKQLLDMFDENGRIVDFEVLSNHLKMQFYKIQYECLSKICNSCCLYETMCNGGCFVAKEHISRNDIINNTGLPVK